MVFVNDDSDRPPRRGGDEPQLHVYRPAMAGTIKANRQSFEFRPFGPAQHQRHGHLLRPPRLEPRPRRHSELYGAASRVPYRPRDDAPDLRSMSLRDQFRPMPSSFNEACPVGHTVVALPPRYSKNGQRGLTLVETLAALVVLSVGLLGTAALQILAMDAGRAAFFRGRAVDLAADMAERIRSNRLGSTPTPGLAPTTTARPSWGQRRLHARTDGRARPVPVGPGR